MQTPVPSLVSVQFLPNQVFRLLFHFIEYLQRISQLTCSLCICHQRLFERICSVREEVSLVDRGFLGGDVR